MPARSGFEATAIKTFIKILALVVTGSVVGCGGGSKPLEHVDTTGLTYTLPKGWAKKSTEGDPALGLASYRETVWSQAGMAGGKIQILSMKVDEGELAGPPDTFEWAMMDAMAEKSAKTDPKRFISKPVVERVRAEEYVTKTGHTARKLHVRMTPHRKGDDGSMVEDRENSLMFVWYFFRQDGKVYAMVGLMPRDHEQTMDNIADTVQLPKRSEMAKSVLGPIH